MELLDRNIVQACMTRENFKLFNEFRKGNTLDEDAKHILGLFARYYKTFDSIKTLNKQEFIDWCDLINPADKEQVTTLVNTFKTTEYSSEYLSDLRKAALKHRAATHVQGILDEYAEGNVEDPIDVIKNEVDSMMNTLGQIDSGLINTSSYSDIFAHEDKDGGLPWFSKGLGEAMHSLLSGRFIIVAASTDCGKTTFLLNNVKHWLKHLNEGEKILWVNNEEVTTALRMRLAQSVLEISEYDLIHKFCEKEQQIVNGEPKMVLKRSETGKFMLDEPKFVKALNDKLGFNLDDRIDWMDAHKASSADIDLQLSKANENYRVIVFDMLDHIKFPTTNNGQQADIEAKYNWARQLASIYDCSVLATSQTSREGNDNRLPKLEDLKDSKVGKQTTCDALIMMGMSETDRLPLVEETTLYSRTISIPKNKMRNVRTRNPKYMDSYDKSVPLIINPVTAAFYDHNDVIDNTGQLII